MKIIDIHTHIYPDDIAQKATESVKKFYEIGGSNMDGTVKTLLEKGKEAGISQFAVLAVAIRSDRVRGINEYIYSQMQAHPEFFGFGAVHAAMENMDEEVRWICDHGFSGIKMHPDSQRFPLDDVRLYPMYEEIQGKMPVMLHMGDHRYDYSHPVRLRKLLQHFPKLQVIAAHFGGHTMYEQACELLKDTDCVLDISSSLMFMPEGQPERFIRIYGPERMAFGTDYPMWNPVEEVGAFMGLKLTPEELEQIAHKTAERILQI